VQTRRAPGGPVPDRATLPRGSRYSRYRFRQGDRVGAASGFQNFSYLYTRRVSLAAGRTRQLNVLHEFASADGRYVVAVCSR
jgi:hypothetical protein